MDVLLENVGYTISVDTRVGAGGLGSASLMGNTDYVFKQPFTLEEFDFGKIRWMIRNPMISSDSDHSFCWPCGIGLDPVTKEPLGCLLPAANGAVDFERLLVHWLPEDYRYRVLRNLAASLADLNRAQMIRGDWPNSMVDKSGRVFEIDMDSIAVDRSDVQYPITATKPDTTSPQALENWEDAQFSIHDDSWAFGVCAWMLLFGEHPFACQWLGAGKRPSLHQRIISGLWPHDGRHSRVGPRRGSRPFSSLDVELQYYFRRCFSLGHSDGSKRPSGDEWEQAFARLDAPGDVSLTDAQWQCVATGTTPSRLRNVRAPLTLPGKKQIATAASLILIGAGGYSAIEQPESQSNGGRFDAVENQSFESLKREEFSPSRSFSQQIQDVKRLRRTPQLLLHEFAESTESETPPLWQHLKERR